MQGILDFLGSLVSAPFICCGWLIVGAVAGALARRLLGSRDAPLINDMILGLIGALVGGLLARVLNIETPSGGIPAVLASLIIATAGAGVLILLGRTLRGGRR